jgi:hypothetical protein
MSRGLFPHWRHFSSLLTKRQDSPLVKANNDL